MFVLDQLFCDAMSVPDRVYFMSGGPAVLEKTNRSSKLTAGESTPGEPAAARVPPPS